MQPGLEFLKEGWGRGQGGDPTHTPPVRGLGAWSGWSSRLEYLVRGLGAWSGVEPRLESRSDERAVAPMRVLIIPVSPLAMKAGSLTAGGLQQEAQPIHPLGCSVSSEYLLCGTCKCRGTQG